jgi:hypothetical protein
MGDLERSNQARTTNIYSHLSTSKPRATFAIYSLIRLKARDKKALQAEAYGFCFMIYVIWRLSADHAKSHTI